MTGKIIKLALFTAISLGLAVYIGAKIVGVHLGATYGLSATFGDATGLQGGDPVRLAGVPVGKVGSVKLVGESAKVTLKVDSNIHLPVDSGATVRWRNLIGQRYVQLTPGQSPVMLRSGAVITKTTSVVDLSALVNDLGPLAAQLNPDQLNSIFTALSQALDGNLGNSQSLVADLHNVLSTLASRNQTISQLLTDYRTITGALATRDQEIESMIDNLTLLSQSFAGNTALVGTALQNFSGLSTGLNQLLTTSGGQISGVIDNLSILTGVLHERIGDLQAALHNLPPALQALFSATNRGAFANIYVLCLDFTPACTLPIVMPTQPAGASAPGGVPLDSAAAYRRLMLGTN
jgi:phospholipid/cholesterol/gamma-HCH transport system substrate-binding protein